MYARDNDVGASHGQQLPDGERELPDGDVVETAATALRLLADPTRLRLMWLLRDAERDVGSLAATTGAARPAVSQHLAKLRLGGLARSRRDGRRVVYRARGVHVRRLVEEIIATTQHRLNDSPDHG
jgi:DNA-binding transcriptional ArsR family regulator